MWFELFHVSNGWPKFEFSTDLFFNDKYLLTLLAVALPKEFEYVDEVEYAAASGSLSHTKQQLHKLKDE